MQAKPRNQLQQEIYDRYQKGRNIAKKMDKVSPTALCKKYGIAKSTVQLCVKGGKPTVISEEAAKNVAREYRRFKNLKKELASHTLNAIADEFGMSRKTVHEWGNGRFGKRDSPNPVITNASETMKSGFKGNFITMKLSSNPQKSPFYY